MLLKLSAMADAARSRHKGEVRVRADVAEMRLDRPGSWSIA